MFYKAPDNSIHDDMGGAAILCAGWPCDAIPVSDEEAELIRQANIPPLSIEQQIIILEATATPRRIREATLGIDQGWLAALDAQIASLRDRLPQNMP